MLVKIQMKATYPPVLALRSTVNRSLSQLIRELRGLWALSSLVTGDTFRANTLFGESYPDVDLVALVDFDNDSVGTSLKCCDALGDRL